MRSFPNWFRGRFRSVCEVFADKRFYEDQGSGEAVHAESDSLRRSKTRYKDTLSLILPELRAPEGLRFADVGGGHLAWFVAPLFTEAVAFDLSGLYENEARALGVETLVWDLTAGDAPHDPESFDVVSFCEVLEHLPPPPFPYLGRVARLLKPGGILLFSVPNMAGIAKRVKFLFGRSPLKLGLHHWKHVGHPHHIREYTVREVRFMLDQVGFDIEILRTADHGVHPWRRLTTQLHRITRGWGRTIMVRARKR